jgi:hypothetical protein
MSILKKLKAVATYLKFLHRHKWGVFLECRKPGIFWRGIVHDWSKFLPSEFFPHLDFFYIKGKSVGKMYLGGDADFDIARLKHMHRNPHHWQYWVMVREAGKFDCLPMPDACRREMLADWTALNGGRTEVKQWYAEHRDMIMLHAETREWLERELGADKN